MYMLYVGIVIAFALGFGFFAPLNIFTSFDMADTHAKTAAASIYTRHALALRWVEENPGFLGELPEEAYSGGNGIDYDSGTFGPMQTTRIAGALLTWISPEDQEAMREGASVRTLPESMLRHLIDIAGNNVYAIGRYEDGVITPLSRSSNLAAPTNTKWSPMDDRDPATIDPALDKPSAKIEWVDLGSPTLNITPPPGMVNGSWVIVTMAPNA